MNMLRKLAVPALIMLAAMAYPLYQSIRASRFWEKSSRADVEHTIDDRVDGLRLVFAKKMWVAYQDGAREPADAIGITAVTLDDHKKIPERLKAQELKEEDFPVVVFFNATGFDSTGAPVIIRRAKDGVKLFPKGEVLKGKLLRVAVPRHSGGWTGYARDGTRIDISDENWEKLYLGLSARPDLNEKEAKSGIKGRVIKVGGNPALVPMQVRVYIFKGRPIIKDLDPRMALSGLSGADGRFTVSLPPGEYTMVIEMSGQLYGNAMKPRDGRWPSFKVEEGWLEYEFRKGQ